MGSGSVLRSVHRIARTHDVREQLERAIREGHWSPGERLPSQRELVERLGASRVSVREAIRSLEAIGLIEVQQGRGCFVAQSIGNGYRDSFARWLEVHANEVLELLSVRGALDELAAECAAERPDFDRLAPVRAAQDRFAAAVADPGADLAERVAADVEFHDAIASAAGSALLVDLLNALHDQMTESRQTTLSSHDRAVRSAAEHEAIVEAIERGRPDEARHAVARHIASVRDSVLELISVASGEGES
jgi:GntR family transcriptional regulator, transcriptional repressor for pyruvate dehydrogenase complex